jgi:hypothetical protein
MVWKEISSRHAGVCMEESKLRYVPPLANLLEDELFCENKVLDSTALIRAGSSSKKGPKSA